MWSPAYTALSILIQLQGTWEEGGRRGGGEKDVVARLHRLEYLDTAARYVGGGGGEGRKMWSPAYTALSILIQLQGTWEEGGRRGGGEKDVVARLHRLEYLDTAARYVGGGGEEGGRRVRVRGESILIQLQGGGEEGGRRGGGTSAFLSRCSRRLLCFYCMLGGRRGGGGRGERGGEEGEGGGG